MATQIRCDVCGRHCQPNPVQTYPMILKPPADRPPIQTGIDIRDLTGDFCSAHCFALKMTELANGLLEKQPTRDASGPSGEPPLEVDLDGYFDCDKGIHYVGVARRQLNGSYRCLAIVEEALCIVEVSISVRASLNGAQVIQ